jgi:hypothetical protein
MNPTDPLPSDLAGIERRLTAWGRAEPSGSLRPAVLDQVRRELIHQRRVGPWQFAGVLAVAALVIANLTLIAASSSAAFLRQPASDGEWIETRAELVRQVLPDLESRVPAR